MNTNEFETLKSELRPLVKKGYKSKDIQTVYKEFGRNEGDNAVITSVYKKVKENNYARKIAKLINNNDFDGLRSTVVALAKEVVLYENELYKLSRVDIGTEFAELAAVDSYAGNVGNVAMELHEAIEMALEEVKEESK